MRRPSRFDPPPRPDPREDDGEGWPGLDYYGIKSECFEVTPNPVTGVILAPDGETILFATYERDDRFGFERWIDDREELLAELDEEDD